MPWVVDTGVLIDVLDHDPQFGVRSANALEERAVDGLFLCPVSYVELAPAFEGSLELQDEFLAGVAVDHSQPWTAEDTRRAHTAWHACVQRRRAGRVAKRPLADILIGGFASRFDGLITRNDTDFRRLFPDLALVVP